MHILLSLTKGCLSNVATIFWANRVALLEKDYCNQKIISFSLQIYMLLGRNFGRGSNAFPSLPSCQVLRGCSVPSRTSCSEGKNYTQELKYMVLLKFVAIVLNGSYDYETAKMDLKIKEITGNSLYHVHGVLQMQGHDLGFQPWYSYGQ